MASPAREPRPKERLSGQPGPPPVDGLGPFQKALLEHPTRDEMVRQLRRTPGLNKNQLANALDVYPNTIEFHLDKLEEADLITTVDGVRDREIVCFVHGEEHLWDNDRTRLLYGRSPTREVALYVLDHPASTARDAAEALDLSPVTVRRHLRKLHDADLVDRKRLRQGFVYVPDSVLAEWRTRVGARFPRPWEDNDPSSA